ncbi:tetratricopeptide repeat protein [Dactylosporangium sp. NPDC049742]|uniref:tetratricopeptide repeat protein n=1 Tax=Dactylosporangium sp. NPDC049742 TaxID=3154737 RepID=UPI00343CB8D3
MTSWIAVTGGVGALVAFAGGPAALSAMHVQLPSWAPPLLVAAAGAITSLVITPVITARMSVTGRRITSREENRDKRADVLLRSMGSTDDLPLVRDVTSRSALGIHPAIPLPVDADPQLYSELPTYVPRDRDADIRTALTRMSGPGGFLLVVGPPAAGKTRSVVTAMQQLLGDWRLYIHSSTANLAEVLETGLDLRRTVVWLDNIHEVLDPSDDASGTQPSGAPDRAHTWLTSDLMRRLILPSNGPVIVIGMTWPEHRDRYTSHSRLSTTGPHADARKIVDMADQIDLSPTFSDAEWRRATQLSASDPRIAEVVQLTHGRDLAAMLANAPDLIRRWRHGGNHYGRAALTAAITARQCGHPEPIPDGVLEALAARDLTGLQRATADANGWFRDALAWACSPIRGDIAPLSPDSTVVGRVEGYSVSDILLNHANNDPELPAPDETAWGIVAAHARSGACAAVCAAARRARRYAAAERAGRRGADVGDGQCHYYLGLTLGDLGRSDEAERHYREAIRLGEPFARNNLANLLAQKGADDEAEAMYRAAISSGWPDAAYNLGVLLTRRGRVQEAEECYRTVAGSGHAAAMNNLALLLVDRGEEQEAEQLYRQAMELGNLGAANNLGRLVSRQGRLEEGRRLYRTAAEAGHIQASNNLAAVLAEDGEHAEAERFYRFAVAAGNAVSMVNLGGLLEVLDRDDEAEALYRQAVAAGSPEAVRYLALLLIRTGRDAEAVATYQLRPDAFGGRGTPPV